MIQQAPLPAGSQAYDWLWLIPALPLAAAALCGILLFLTLRSRGAGKKKAAAHGHGHAEAGHGADAHAAHGHDAHGADEHSADHGHAKVAAGIGGLGPWVAALSMYAAFALSLKGFAILRELPEAARVIRSTSWAWIDTGTFGIDVAMHLDPLSSVMTLVVTGIGALIFTYAAGYMKGDPGYAKFFGYLALQRFGIRFQRDYFALGLAAPNWLRVMNLVYTLAPTVLAPTVFQGLGSFMAMVSGVPGVETHPAFIEGMNYDRAATWFDAQLKHMDIQLFGVYLPQWARQFHTPWLCGILFWCYLVYFLCPFVAALPPIIKGKWSQVRLAVAMLHSTLFMTYVLYIFVPATGPRFEGSWEAWLTAERSWFWAREMAAWVDSVEVIRWDAFPSGHVATSITCMIVALMLHRRVGLVYLPFVVGLTIATILLGYHYGTDVLAGFMCVVLTFAFCLPAIKWWEKATNPV